MTVPLKEEEWIAIPNVQLFPEGNSLGSLALSATVDVLVTSSNGSFGPSQRNVLIAGTT
jgi:hypothetical protein